MPFLPRRFTLILTLAALPLLLGGKCAVFWNTGDDDDDDDDERVIIVAGGQLTDPVVAGLRYVSGTTSGITGENGEFSFEPDEAVQFSIGDITLGEPVPASPAMSVADLVAQDNDSETAERNIRRLLKSLDADPMSATISIPTEVHTAAVSTNEVVAPAITFLDFSDDSVFTNSASQLVAVLTYHYPFTATLLEADQLPAQRTRQTGQ